jgi:hypothetical protein
MSETSQGDGWWLASDGKWYPPEAWTGPQAQTGQALYTLVEHSAGYQSPEPSAGYPLQPRRTNGLAVASLACACAGIIPFLFGLPCVLGIIFGFVARSQIKNARGTQGGDRMALARIIVDFSVIALFILAVVLIAAFDSAAHRSSAPVL